MVSTSNFAKGGCPCYYLEFISRTSIHLILDRIKCWHHTAHLGLLAPAQDAFISEK